METFAIYLPMAILIITLFIMLEEGRIPDSPISIMIRSSLNIPIKSKFLADISMERYQEKMEF